MPLTVDDLAASAELAAAADSPEEALCHLQGLLEVLASPAALAEACIRGTAGSGEQARDYGGILAAMRACLDRGASRWPGKIGEAVRAGALRAIHRQPPSPSPTVSPSSARGAAASSSAPAAAAAAAEEERPPGAEGDDDDESRASFDTLPPNSGDEGDGDGAGGGRRRGGGSPSAVAAMTALGLGEEAAEGTEEAEPGEGPLESGTADATVPETSPPREPEVATATTVEESSSSAGTQTESPATAPEEDEDSEPLVWMAVLLAMLLPLLADALPRDPSGVCIIPHPHQMEEQEASVCIGLDRQTFRTNKICDNCGQRIQDRFFFHCAENCDIDFCQECHRRSQDLLCSFLERSGDQDTDSMNRRLFWVIDVTERIGFHVLHRSVAQRERLASELAFEWPTPAFEQLAQAAIDVVNARVVHVEDVKDITSDSRFWYAVGWLQFLYAANALPCRTKRLDEQGTRGPKLDYERFALEAINKCEPLSEFQRWKDRPSAKVPDMLAVEKFQLSPDFCSFLSHSNLVPVSFRRMCLLFDVWERIQLAGRISPLQLEVPRAPKALLAEVLSTFQGLGERELRRPLRVTFVGEEAIGQGVMKEFFQVVLRSFIGGGADSAGDSGDEDGNGTSLFKCNGQRRLYWFDDEASDIEAFRACGILLGQAVLNSVFVPNIFPRVLYEKLLQDLDSPCARQLTLADLATVSDEIAQSLQRVLDHSDEDIGAVFGDLDWQGVDELGQLTQANKRTFVQAYVDWFLHERISKQFEPLSAGFRAILGDSSLLRSMVDSVQLEKIMCGGAVPVDVAAIRRGAAHEGWTTEEELEYLPAFWEVLTGFTEAEKVQFVLFVTASDRVPLRGWQDLGVTVQKNGVGDDRLPTAYTCFCQLLLPRYTDKEHLRASLLTAIANSEGFGLR